jgi:hypothetical protein
MIQDHLALAEEHVSRGQVLIDKQRELLSEMRARGDPVDVAEALLIQLEETQRLHISDRDRLRAELQRHQQR